MSISEETRERMRQSALARSPEAEARRITAQWGNHEPKGYVFNFRPGYPGANQRGYIRRSRFVMSEHLGRPLRSDEIVHHKDGNRRNDALENLELIDWGEHSRHHNTGRIKSPAERQHISAAHRGRSLPPEWRQHISEAMKRHFSQLHTSAQTTSTASTG